MTTAKCHLLIPVTLTPSSNLRPPLLNMTSRTFHLRYRPHRELSIDDAIVGYKGRHILKMYNPSKPQKLGFKVWQLADAHNWYVHSQILYRRKPREPLPYGQGYEVAADLTASGCAIISIWTICSPRSIMSPLYFSETYMCPAEFVQTASVCQMQLKIQREDWPLAPA